MLAIGKKHVRWCDTQHAVMVAPILDQFKKILMIAKCTQI